MTQPRLYQPVFQPTLCHLTCHTTRTTLRQLRPQSIPQLFAPMDVQIYWFICCAMFVLYLWPAKASSTGPESLWETFGSSLFLRICLSMAQIKIISYVRSVVVITSYPPPTVPSKLCGIGVMCCSNYFGRHGRDCFGNCDEAHRRWGSAMQVCHDS